MKYLYTVALAAIGLIYPCAVDASELVRVAEVPGSVPNSTAAIGLADNGVINGSYVSSTDGSLHGFVGTPDGHYQLYDVGSGGTQGRGVNNAGWQTGFSGADSCNPNNSCVEFEVSPSGSQTMITMNGNQLYGIVQGINSKGIFVGNYHPEGAPPNHAKGYYGYEGKYVGDLVLPFPTTQTKPRGINNAGTVVGLFTSPTDQGGFILSNDSVTIVRYPDTTAIQTHLEGINDHGWISGGWLDSSGSFHSFLLSPDLSTFYDLDIPGSSSTQSFAINNSNEVAVNGDSGAYMFCLDDGGRCHSPKASAAIAISKHPAAGAIETFACTQRCGFVGGAPE